MQRSLKSAVIICRTPTKPYLKHTFIITFANIKMSIISVIWLLYSTTLLFVPILSWTFMGSSVGVSAEGRRCQRRPTLRRCQRLSESKSLNYCPFSHSIIINGHNIQCIYAFRCTISLPMLTLSYIFWDQWDAVITVITLYCCSTLWSSKP